MQAVPPSPRPVARRDDPQVFLLGPRSFHGQSPDTFPDGEFPGQEAVFTLPDTQVTMTLCWCPPSTKGDVPGFWIAKHPVSQIQWSAVMGSNPSQKGKGDDFPVDSVSWEDAQEFCGRIRLRLPSELEWEHACRAATSTDFALGVGTAIHSQIANFDGNHPVGGEPHGFKWLWRRRTTPEGSFPPNAWGLHDMHGQLWEWCEDEAFGGRALRGGSWNSGGWGAAAGDRDGSHPGIRYDHIGFRPCPGSKQQERKGGKGKAVASGAGQGGKGR